MAKTDPDKIIIENVQQLTVEVQALVSFLAKDETEHTWEQIDKAIKRFHAAVRGGACKFSDELVAALKQKDMVAGLVRSMNTERTRLSASALDLMASLTRLGHAFAPLLPPYLPHLLRLLCRTNKLYITRAVSTLLAIASKTKLPALLTFIAAEWRVEPGKSTSYRASAIQIVYAMLGDDTSQMADKDGIEKRIEDLEWIIQVSAVDRESKVRAEAKKVWGRYKTEWPERVAAFTAPLTPITRRYLSVALPAGSAPTTKPPVPKAKAPKIPPALTSRQAPPTLADRAEAEPSASAPVQAAHKPLAKSVGPSVARPVPTTAPVTIRSPPRQPLSRTVPEAAAKPATSARDVVERTKLPETQADETKARPNATASTSAPVPAPIGRARAGFRPTPSTALSRSAGPSRAVPASDPNADAAPVVRRRAGRAVPPPVPTVEAAPKASGPRAETTVRLASTSKTTAASTSEPAAKDKGAKAAHTTTTANDKPAQPARTGFRPKPPPSSISAFSVDPLSKAKRALGISAGASAPSSAVKPAKLILSPPTSAVSTAVPLPTQDTNTNNLVGVREELARALAKAVTVPLPLDTQEADIVPERDSIEQAHEVAEPEQAAVETDVVKEEPHVPEPLDETAMIETDEPAGTEATTPTKDGETVIPRSDTLERRLDFLAHADTNAGEREVPDDVEDLSASTIGAPERTELVLLHEQTSNVANNSETMVIVEETMRIEPEVESPLEDSDVRLEVDLDGEALEPERGVELEREAADTESETARVQDLDEPDEEAEAPATETPSYTSKTEAFFASFGSEAWSRVSSEDSRQARTIRTRTACFFVEPEDVVFPYSMRIEAVLCEQEARRLDRLVYDEEAFETCSIHLSSPPRVQAGVSLRLPGQPQTASPTPVASTKVSRDDDSSQTEMTTARVDALVEALPLQSSPTPASFGRQLVASPDCSADSSRQSLVSPLAASRFGVTQKRNTSPSFYGSNLRYDDSSFEEDEDEFGEENAGDMTAIGHREAVQEDAQAHAQRFEDEEEDRIVLDETFDYAAQDFGMPLNDESMMSTGRHFFVGDESSVLSSGGAEDETMRLDSRFVRGRSMRPRMIAASADTSIKDSAKSTRHRDVLSQIQ